MEVILITIMIVLLLAGLVVLYWRAGRNVVDLAPLLNKLDTLRDFSGKNRPLGALTKSRVREPKCRCLHSRRELNWRRP